MYTFIRNNDFNIFFIGNITALYHVRLPINFAKNLHNVCYTHFIKINLAYILAVQIQPLLYSSTTAMSCPVLHGHFVFLEGEGRFVH